MGKAYLLAMTVIFCVKVVNIEEGEAAFRYDDSI